VFRKQAAKLDLDIVRLATPTTDDARLTTVLDGAGGFLYYVSVAGVTGTKTFTAADVSAAVARIRRASALPCAVRFRIKTPEQAAEIARIADATVVGSAIVTASKERCAKAKPAARSLNTLNFCRGLADAVHEARGPASPRAIKQRPC